MRMPAIVPTMRKLATTSAPRPGWSRALPTILKVTPVRIGIATTTPGRTICRSAPDVTMSTALP